MKIMSIFAPIAAAFVLAACTASTAPSGSAGEPTATKDVFYVTPAVAASMSLNDVKLQDGLTEGAVKEGELPFIRNDADLVPATSEEMSELKAHPEAVCWACDDDGKNCIRICCPFEKCVIKVL